MWKGKWGATAFCRNLHSCILEFRFVNNCQVGLIIIVIGRECSIAMETDTLHTAKGGHFFLVIDGRSTKQNFKLPAGRLASINQSSQNLFNNPPNSVPSGQTQPVPWTAFCTEVAVTSLDFQIDRRTSLLTNCQTGWLIELSTRDNDWKQLFQSHLSCSLWLLTKSHICFCFTFICQKRYSISWCLTTCPP